VATARSKYLSTGVAGGSTGVFVGLYTTGNGEPCGSPARFERFVYGPVERE
jgi:alpha-N-arabinofuranosidase